MKIHYATLQTIYEHKLKPFAFRDRLSNRYWAGYPEPFSPQRPLLFTEDMFETAEDALYYLDLLVQYEEQEMETWDFPVKILYDKHVNGW
jgi:hypothetical protein